MAILMRSGNDAWVEVARKAFAQEKHLQTLLLKSPELIETFDGSKLLLTDEAGLKGGLSIDLLGVTSDGEILIVETKLASNAEIRRKIIGQIFEYAALLWKTDYTVFNDYFQKKRNQSIIEEFGAADNEFEGESFRAQVEQNLKAGRFHLLIAVDEMNDELNAILDYISSCGQGFRLEALAIRLYEKASLQILAPQRYGMRLAPPSLASAKLTVEELINNSLTLDMKQKMQLINDEWIGAGYFVFPAKVGLSLRAGLPAKVVTLFWATPNDTWGIQPNFTSMQQSGMPETVLAEVRKQLCLIPGINKDKMLTGATPVIKFSALSHEGVSQFVKTMIHAVQRWRESLEVSAESKDADSVTI